MEETSHYSTGAPMRRGSRQFRMLIPAESPTEHRDKRVAYSVKLVLAVLVLLLVAFGPQELRQWPDAGLFLLIAAAILAIPVHPQWELAFNCYFVVEPGYLYMYLGLPEPKCRLSFNLSDCTKAKLGDVRHPHKMRLQLHTRWGWAFTVPPLEDMEALVTAVAAQLPVEIERQNARTKLPWSHIVVVGTVVLTVSLVGFLCLRLMFL